MKLSLKDLPPVHQVLLEVNSDIEIHEDYLKFIINKVLNQLRGAIKTGSIQKTKDELFKQIVTKVWIESAPRLVNVINGTGIVLHTGFGRAPFDGKKIKRIAQRLDGYVNLEYDLVSGNRGERQSHIQEQLSALCGSESAIMVNNNAAAVLLSLNTITDGGEVICSRGQLVEIGGSFRIPDIITKSGAILKGVGTTNRTHLKDYEKAISKRTKLILWVHTSNYVIKGFTKDVSLADLASLGRKHKIPVLADLGSGALLNMTKLGLADEIPVKSIVNSGPDITTFSGDKLLGGPQSGLIVGKKEWISAFQKNPLYRVLRCDKITIGLMEETLRSYRSDSFTKDNFSLKMLTTSRKVLRTRAEKVFNGLKTKTIRDLGITIVESFVEAGSGSLPEKNIASMALQFKPKSRKVTELAAAFRCGSIPVVGYITADNYYIDLKAVLPVQIRKLTVAISEV
ncbi:MAG: L-seryl-tRNA(Sec) selenium transferase [Candidatus Neomarinimicrobiota bacterium]|nr:L-seryl-tRNA(Sec) selenium transferase [Candidatus Neomarinimicrobiota bacterium]